ncbi:hypothetical protein G6F46_014577 [Rhizopus delemar]|nr:hypothetical protein G6F46_014577 [Rhizopus delemar]
MIDHVIQAQWRGRVPAQRCRPICEAVLGSVAVYGFVIPNIPPIVDAAIIGGPDHELASVTCCVLPLRLRRKLHLASDQFSHPSAVVLRGLPAHADG